MNRNQAQEKIKILSEKLNYYNDQYYQHHHSEVSDFEFDQMIGELVKIEDAFPDLKSAYSPTQRVGGTITKEFETVFHKYPMLSLGNTYSREELNEFDQRVKKGLNTDDYSYICELKFDGVAISITYEDGILKQGVTRGDGERGDNVTNNVKTIRSIPLKIEETNLPKSFEVRGEVFMPLEVFNELNRQRESNGESLLANPRNTASGTLKMQDSSVVAQRKLNCYLYSLLSEDLEINTHFEAIKLLERWGFNVSPTYRQCKNIQEVFEYIDHWEARRLELPVDTDGVVIKVNHYNHHKKLGFTAKSPRWAISYKYKSENVSTILNQIVYQVGRTGAITPVANLQPVLLAGTTVKRASLHNANEIQRLDLREGDTVFVEKGGEIIPKITGIDRAKRVPNSQKVEYVTKCPACDTPLIRKEGEAVHFCPNQLGCPPQIIGRIEHFIQRSAMNINSLGGKTIELLYREDLVRNPSDLYNLTFDQIFQLDRFKEQSTQNILNGINASKEVPFENVLFALGIRYVGKTVAEKLAAHFKNIESLKSASLQELIEVPEIGDRIAESVVDYFNQPENLKLVAALEAAGLKMAVEEEKTSESNILAGKSFVISGVFDKFGRDELKQVIKIHGGKIVSAVSGSVDFLVAGANMGPAKKTKAEKMGVTIISELDFQKMIDQ